MATFGPIAVAVIAVDMPFYRGRSRSYGRRRRYNRRRPAASTAVPRTTLAPRHQYLKLRTSFHLFTDPSVTAFYGCVLNLDNPSVPVQNLNAAVVGTPLVASPSLVNDRVALGYSEYGQIFKKFLVHGCKVVCHIDLENTQASNTAFNSSSCIWLPRIDNSTVTTGYQQVARLPMSFQNVVTFSRPTTVKRYFSTSKIQGRSVKLFNEYYYPWDLPVSSPTNGSTLQMYTEQIELGIRMNFRFTMTYYLSALEVKSDFSDPAAMAAVVKATLPGPGLSADRDPTHASFVDDSLSGVPLSTDHMRKLGVTRRRD